jgi:hypothetical protein
VPSCLPGESYLWPPGRGLFADQGRNVDKHSEFISMSSIGMVGLTAYFGAFDVAKLEKDQVVVVSGAAGYVCIRNEPNSSY